MVAFPTVVLPFLETIPSLVAFPFPESFTVVPLLAHWQLPSKPFSSATTFIPRIPDKGSSTEGFDET